MGNYIDILPLVPSLSFLVSASFYYFLDRFGLCQDYNFHKNRPRSYDLRDISFRVFAIQAITTTISFINHYFTKEEVHNEIMSSQNSFLWSCIKVLLGMLTIDTFQFWSHYALHSPFLFRQFHMVHHMITKTYSFMAFYNSYAEGVLMDIVGAIITQQVCFLNPLQFNVLIAIATMKAVSDHSGYMIPWDPFTWFPNNAYYHQKHHNPRTMGFNYEQPFFTFWDGLMGTRLLE